MLKLLFKNLILKKYSSSLKVWLLRRMNESAVANIEMSYQHQCITSLLPKRNKRPPSFRVKERKLKRASGQLAFLWSSYVACFLFFTLIFRVDLAFLGIRGLKRQTRMLSRVGLVMNVDCPLAKAKGSVWPLTEMLLLDDQPQQRAFYNKPASCKSGLKKEIMYQWMKRQTIVP